MAARAGLRVLPLIVAAGLAPEFRSAIVLPNFRAMALAWTAATYPAYRSRLRRTNPNAVRAAVRGADAYAASVLGTEVHAAAAARAAAHAIAAAAEAADLVTAVAAAATAAETYYLSSSDPRSDGSAVEPYYASADAYRSATAMDIAAGDGASALAVADYAKARADARAAVIAAAQFDVELINEGSTRQKRGTLAIQVTSTRLWPSAVPPMIAPAWSQLKSVLTNASECWEIWIKWYEDRLVGRHPRSPEPELAIATVPKALWDKGPKAVNEHIRRLVEAPDTQGALTRTTRSRETKSVSRFGLGDAGDAVGFGREPFGRPVEASNPPKNEFIRISLNEIYKNAVAGRVRLRLTAIRATKEIL